MGVRASVDGGASSGSTRAGFVATTVRAPRPRHLGGLLAELLENALGCRRGDVASVGDGRISTTPLIGARARDHAPWIARPAHARRPRVP